MVFKMKKVIYLILVLVLIYFGYEYYIYDNYIPVLAYHNVVENPINETDISVENFKSQMEYLYKHNYKTLSLEEYYNWKNGSDIKGKKILLTFDDGNESFYKTVVPILEEYNFNGVNFVIESALNNEDYMTIEEVNDLTNNHSNIEIASHSYNNHNSEDANSNSYDIYNDDLKEFSIDTSYYAYPFGICNDNYIKALEDNQYKLAFLYSPSKWSSRKQSNYEITRVPIYRSNSILKFILKLKIKI